MLRRATCASFLVLLGACSSSAVDATTTSHPPFSLTGSEPTPPPQAPDAGTDSTEVPVVLVSTAKPPAPIDGIVFATTEDALYSLDPGMHTMTKVGAFKGADGPVTDIAISGAGTVFVSTRSTLYTSHVGDNAGDIELTALAHFSMWGVATNIVALGVVPAGMLGAEERLVGGTDDGHVVLVDSTSGAVTDLGNFGSVAGDPIHVLALSGDIDFFFGTDGQPRGIATAHECSSVCAPSGGASCDQGNDVVVTLDMTALETAIESGQPRSLIKSEHHAGNGTGQGKLLGLAAWRHKMFAFGPPTDSSEPRLLVVSPTTGRAVPVTNHVPFRNGWTGAATRTTTPVMLP